MHLLKLSMLFGGAREVRPNQEALAERVSGDGEHPPADRRSGAAFTWLLKHRLVWLIVVALTLAALFLSPVTSFLLTRSGSGAAVNATLAFLVVSLLWLMKRHFEITHMHREELLHRSQRLEKNYDAIAYVLSTAVVRDPATAEHSDRLWELMAVLARQLGLRQQEPHNIRLAATLHDIGKLGVAETVLSKPGALDDAEWAEMREHPRIGYEILRGIGFLGGAAEIVYAHHERYDGTGYPRGLADEQIPLGARIFAVVDAYDAIVSHRPYRRARSHNEAMQELVRHAGTQFDPGVVSAFLKALSDVPTTKGRESTRSGI